MAKIREFQQCLVQVGDKRVPGFRVECCKCGQSEAIQSTGNMRNTSGYDKDQSVKLTIRKFEGLGWKLGNNSAHDTCIKCVVMTARGDPIPPPKNVTPRTQHLTLVEKMEMPPADTSKPATSTGTPAASHAPEQPRQMTLEDSFLIMGKLKEYYIDADKGYDGDWTDSKIAKDLGCPRDWVKQVREKVYGEGSAGNDEIEAALAEARAIVDSAKSAFKEIKQIQARLTELVSTVARAEPTITKIERTMETVRRAVGA